MQFFGIFLATVLAGFTNFYRFVITFTSFSLQIVLMGFVNAGGDSVAPCKP